ncbi:MAG: RluA family pseudouridine synthase, partial [Actinomycetota bacterium]
MISFTINDDQVGGRLDSIVALRAKVGSRAEAQRLIAAGLVTVGGAARAKNYRLRPGEVVNVTIPPAEATGIEPEVMDLKIPYEDDYLLVVDKPAGLVSHPSKGHETGTLVHGLLGRRIAGGENARRPGIVHRLDRDTSGLMIVARDKETHRRLAGMLSRRQIERTYLALVYGLFETATGTIKAPVGRDATDRKKMGVSYGAGREAVTHFKVLKGGIAGKTAGARKAGEEFSFLEVRLESGRTHQIRVHLAAIAHPVAGDKTYGRRRDVLGIGRQFLHSARLAFKHPVTGDAVEV